MRIYYETRFLCSFDPILGGVPKTATSPSEKRVKAEKERMDIVRAEIDSDMKKLGQLLQVVSSGNGPLVPLRIVK